VVVDFVRENVAVRQVCFFLVRSTSLELSLLSAAAGLLELGRAVETFGSSWDLENGTVVDTVRRSQLLTQVERKKAAAC
jgi:hypothetical protein